MPVGTSSRPGTMAGLLGLLLFAIPGSLPGQDLQQPPCGGLEDREAVMEDLARYFVAEELAAVREAAGIEQLPEDFDRRALVRRLARPADDDLVRAQGWHLATRLGIDVGARR